MVNKRGTHAMRTLIFTVFALIAFAANSVLNRLALGTSSIDAPSYTIIRLLSGALVLFAILGFREGKNSLFPKGSWLSGLMLFLYAITFSFAYITLDTGTGALILFGVVQVTMIAFSVFSGNRLHITEWLGVIIAFAGFVYLLLPGIRTPSLSGLLLMTLAGIAWGVYTLRGSSSENPLADTTYNFLRTIPIIIILFVITFRSAHYTVEGVIYAILSGAIASGIGYTIWYIALGGLSTTQAAVVQLSVPVIAALGGVIFIGEVITLRLTISAAMILGGILLVVIARHFFGQQRIDGQA